MHDVTCAAAHAKWQGERHGWITECTCFVKSDVHVKLKDTDCRTSS